MTRLDIIEALLVGGAAAFMSALILGLLGWRVDVVPVAIAFFFGALYGKDSRGP